MPIEAAESKDADGNDVPVRPSITMMKPTIDFNAAESSNKSSHSQNTTQTSSESEASTDSKRKKGAGKVFWNMATSLKNMVAKRLTSPMKQQKRPSNEANSGAASNKEEGTKFEEVISANSATDNRGNPDIKGPSLKAMPNELDVKQDRLGKFTSFEDQLKQIRLSRDYLESNPKIAEQVILSESARLK